MRKKKDESVDAPVDLERAPGPLTPRDIQEKVFRTQAGLRGYNEREVDEFLDRITEEFARMHAENQRLRGALAAGTAAVPPEGGPPPGGDTQAQEITSSFVAREREFLRNLATLIQNHAEAVKQDIGRARAPAPASAAVPAPAPPAETPATAVPTAPAVPETAPGGQTARPAALEPAGLPVGAGGGSLAPPAAPALDLAGARPEPVMAGAAEPAPAKGGPDEQTIRELFWGEE